MPLKINQNVTAGFKGKCEAFLAGIQEAIPIAGEAVRDAIVHSTLLGVGENDVPFKAYSTGYQAILDSVGGKPGGVVDLRGIFVKEGYKGGKPRRFKDKKKELGRQRRALARGAGRRAFVQVTIGDRSFIAQTKHTRPRMGLVDPQSEMSADLIKVVIQKTGFRLDYKPRQKDYMLNHNETRPWFSVQKTMVKAALSSVLSTVFKALIRNFNGR